jgi:5-methylcytosine-specific restriction endonuclease McrA
MTKPKKRHDPLPTGNVHCLEEAPYRMIVYVRSNRETPLYQVAGSSAFAMGAEKALREAHRVHGGSCFYCRAELGPDQMTIDHAQARKHGGGEQIQNLLLACGTCNRGKADRPIELFNPDAGREWLGAVLKEVQTRLRRS